MHATHADIITHVTFIVDTNGTLTCNTSETRVNWVRYSPTRTLRISYQNHLLPSEPGKYELDGNKVTVNNVSEQDAGEYHCETPDYHHIFFVAVQFPSKNVFNIFQIAVYHVVKNTL